MNRQIANVFECTRAHRTQTPRIDKRKPRSAQHPRGACARGLRIAVSAPFIVRGMKFLLSLFGLIAATAGAAPQIIKLDTRRSLPISVRLRVPEGIHVAAHGHTEEGDTVTFGIEESVDTSPDDLETEIVDAAGHVVWRWTVAVNASTSENTFTVVAHPNLPLLLLKRSGYRSDAENLLLFVRSGPGRTSVATYSQLQRDLVPFLREAADFPSGYGYFISPAAFTPDGVRFWCAPLNPRRQTESFFFAMEQPFYEVDTVVLTGEHVTPVEFVVPDDPYTRRFVELQQWRSDHLEFQSAEFYAAADRRCVFLEADADYRLVSTEEAAIVWQVVDPATRRRWWTQSFVHGAAGHAHVTFLLSFLPSEADGPFDLSVHLDFNRHRAAHPALDYGTTLDITMRDRRLYRAAQY